jgi:hypothetical protein
MRNSLLWLPWLAVVVVAGVAGGVLGLTGVFGHPTTNRAVFANDASLARTAPAYSCPGGSQVTSLQAHDRVLATARSKDSSYLGVRDPMDISRTVWVSRSVVALDSGQAAIATLPVDSCPTVGILMPPTKHTGTTPISPSKPTTPTNPTKPTHPDKTAPKTGTPTAGTPVVCTPNGDPPYSDTITVTATDNVGVTSVAISWTGAETGSGHMTHAGGSKWTYLYKVGTSNNAGTLTFQVQARDAAGNLSSPTKVNVTQGGCVG